MPNTNILLENPVTGETFTILATGQDTGGEYFQFDYTLKPGSFVPVAHIHPQQGETFEVRQGELSILINGKTDVVRAGEAYTIPAGAAHQPRNSGAELLQAQVTFRPAHPKNGDAVFFETYCGFASDGKAANNGAPPFLALAVLLNAYSDFNYLTGPPIPVQKALFKVASLIGRLRGYKARYPEYSGSQQLPRARA